MFLQRPEKENPASRLADWLELQALARPASAVGSGELEKMVRVESEERETRRRRDAVTGELEEGEITATESQDLSRVVFVELRRRASILKEEYPFAIETVGKSFSTRDRLRLNERWSEGPGSVAYIYCLLISAIRLSMVALNGGDEDIEMPDGRKFYSEFRYGYLLQICAAIALGGYLKGDVISFGYPRPDKSSFLPAHKKAWERIGAYAPCSGVPLGAPTDENDAGIDLIGWLNFHDKQPSKILVFGQVASGRNWTGKSVVDRANALRSWFNSPTFTFFIPAMIMPFNVTDARKTIRSEGAGDLRRSVFEFEERQFGVLLDRDRVCWCISEALRMRDEDKARVEGITDFPQVISWVSEAVRHLRDAA